MGMGGWDGLRMTRSLPFAFFLFVGVLALPLRFSLCVASSVRVSWGSVARSLEPRSKKKTEEPNERFRTKYVSEDVCCNIDDFSGSRPKVHFNENKFRRFSVSLLFLNQLEFGGIVFTFMLLAVSAVQFFSSEGRFACLSAAHGR